MGRWDPQYTPEQNQQAIDLVLKDGLSQRAAAAEMVNRGIEMSDSHIGRLITNADPPSLDENNPVGELAQRMLVLANREVAALERTYSKHSSKPLELDRAAKATKLLIDLDKLLKANRRTEPEKSETGPLDKIVAALANGSDQ